MLAGRGEKTLDGNAVAINGCAGRRGPFQTKTGKFFDNVRQVVVDEGGGNHFSNVIGGGHRVTIESAHQTAHHLFGHPLDPIPITHSGFLHRSDKRHRKFFMRKRLL